MKEFDRRIAPQISLYKKLLEYFINFTNNYKNNMTAGAVRSRILTCEKYWFNYRTNDTQSKPVEMKHLKVMPILPNPHILLKV